MLCYRLGVSIFFLVICCVQLVPGSLRGIFMGGHVVSCASIIGSRSGISARKEVDVGLCGERDKPLRPADILLYNYFKTVCQSSLP